MGNLDKLFKGRISVDKLSIGQTSSKSSKIKSPIDSQSQHSPVHKVAKTKPANTSSSSNLSHKQPSNSTILPLHSSIKKGLLGGLDPAKLSINKTTPKDIYDADVKPDLIIDELPSDSTDEKVEESTMDKIRKAALQGKSYTEEVIIKTKKSKPPSPSSPIPQPIKSVPSPANTDKVYSVQPYASKPRKHILTEAETVFYNTLKQCIPVGTQIMLKVRLFDIAEIKNTKANKKVYYSGIMMHIDYTIVSTSTLRVLLAIELDDRSHLSHKKVDNIKNSILSYNHIPLLRVKCAKRYSRSEILTSINNLIYAK